MRFSAQRIFSWRYLLVSFCVSNVRHLADPADWLFRFLVPVVSFLTTGSRASSPPCVQVSRSGHQRGQPLVSLGCGLFEVMTDVGCKSLDEQRWGKGGGLNFVPRRHAIRACRLKPSYEGARDGPRVRCSPILTIRVRKGQNQLFFEEVRNLYLVGITIYPKLIQEGEQKGTRTSYAARKSGISIRLL